MLSFQTKLIVLLHSAKPNLLSPITANPFNPTHPVTPAIAASKHVQSSPHSLTHFQSQPEPNPTQIITRHLESCSNLLQLDEIHAQMIRFHTLELNPPQFHWNSIIRSYVRLQSPLAALRVYIRMSRAGIWPDSYTIPAVLKAACQLFRATLGGQLHSVSVRCGLNENEFCESGLITLYGKAGRLESALQVFDENPERKLGSWNSIIAGFSQSGRSKEAIDAFVELRKCGFVPDDVTMVSVASACGSLGDLDLGLQIHKCVFQARDSARSDVLMMNSLIDMYGKCGRVDLANRVFEGTSQRNVSTWTSLIMGMATHGHVKDALDCFHGMMDSGVTPNHVTFVAVLSACVHGGLAEEGRYYFDMMMHVYGIVPMLCHYGCLVDLMGRVGLFEEAREIIEKMPMNPNSVIWGALLGACEKHGNVEMGEWAAEKLVVLEPWNDGVYVVLSNIYAAAHRWDGVEKVRRLMTDRKVAKIPGYSSPMAL